MLTLNFFAGLREALDREQEQMMLPEGVRDVAGLVEHLVNDRDDRWVLLRDNAQVLVAVNQTIVERTCPLQGDEEVAFFPPMTGG